MKPTDSELEILQILWKDGPSTVKAVNEELNKKRNVGYTTTLKIMQIMHEKGILERELQHRSHIYSPTLQPEEVRRSVLDHMINTAFNGNTSTLVLQALGNHKATQEEIDAIKKLLDTMLNYGLSGLDIVKQIQKEIWNLEIDGRKKIDLVDKCGEIEFRMVEGADEFIQLEALLSQVVLAGIK